MYNFFTTDTKKIVFTLVFKPGIGDYDGDQNNMNNNIVHVAIIVLFLFVDSIVVFFTEYDKNKRHTIHI